MEYVLAIDIGSSKVCVVVAKLGARGSLPEIIAVSKKESRGITKGIINNIEIVSRDLREALNEVREMSGIADLKRATVSISNAYASWEHNSHSVRVENGEVQLKEIERVIKTAAFKSNIPAVINEENIVIHVLPYRFFMDGNKTPIEDPMDMSGKMLECLCHIVHVKRSGLENLKKVLERCGLEIEDVVLSSYASSIAVLTNEERAQGVACIDMGAATCDIMVYHGSSMYYNDFWPVGSQNITIDFAKILAITQSTAEEIKMKYNNMILTEEDKLNGIEIKDRNSENRSLVPIQKLWDFMDARVSETLNSLNKKLEKHNLHGMLRGGVVLTGGMAKLKNLQKYINNNPNGDIFFKGLPVRIAAPILKDSLFENIGDCEMATVVGLVMYRAGRFTNYELTLNGRFKVQSDIDAKMTLESKSKANVENLQLKEQRIQEKHEPDSENAIPQKENVFRRVWNWFLRLF